MDYKLLTPGPLTTTRTVKQEMLFDYSTWDDDYKAITQTIRADLLKLAQVSELDYSAVLMQGSGSFGVESVISSVVGSQDKLLICSNGAYGDRIVEMCDIYGISYILYREADNRTIDSTEVEEILDEDKDVTHVVMIHSETTTGLLNDIEAVGAICHRLQKTFIVDAMSSFGGINIPVQDWHIDFIISSANKCIQGVPGFSFIIGRKKLMVASEGKARTLSLNLFKQWETMDVDGKWRFTSPTHTVVAFRKAMDELAEEGGIEARHRRYAENNRLLNRRMEEIGFENYLTDEAQGPFISTFLVPQDKKFNFNDLYLFAKERGYVIYPGKLTDRESFRIGNIGEIYEQDILNVTHIIEQYVQTANQVVTELVIFDWAGTTVDFGCMAPVAAFRKAFESVGITVQDAEIRQPMGMSKIDHVRTMLQMDRIKQVWQEQQGRAWTEEDVKAIYKVSEEALLETVGDYSQPKPYVLAVVENLRQAKIQIGSTTGYNTAMMNIVVPKAEEHGFRVDSIFTSDDTHEKGRPHPLMIFATMEKLGVKNPSSVIKVGDTVADILEGKNAGVRSLAILDGSSEMGLSLEEFQNLTEEEKQNHRDRVRVVFEKAGADFILNDMRDLLTYLNI